MQVRELKEYLSASLPDYMIPTYFTLMEAWPLNANGKIDRKQLPKPNAEDAQAASDFVAPRTDLEKHLAELWKDILGLSAVGVTDNFFLSGGHSLSAAQMVARIEEEFEVKINLRNVFMRPNIEALASEIESIQWLNQAQPQNHSCSLSIAPHVRRERQTP